MPGLASFYYRRSIADLGSAGHHLEGLAGLAGLAGRAARDHRGEKWSIARIPVLDVCLSAPSRLWSSGCFRIQDN